MKKKWEALFSQDGRLIGVLQKLGELILLDCMLFLCCIPLLTLGAALPSFYYAVIKSVRRERGTPLASFFSSMKRILKKGISTTVVLLLWGGLLYLGRRYAAVQENTHLLAAYHALGLVSLAVLVYLFPVLSRFEMGLMSCLKLSFVLCLRFLPYTVLILAGSAALAYVQFYYLPIPCILLLPGCFCYAVTHLMEPALLAYMPKPKEDSNEELEWYYEK